MSDQHHSARAEAGDVTASNRLLQGVGAAVRARFPIFEHTTYANSCSQGALSNRVRAAAEEWLAGWDENGAEWEFWVERNEAARAAFAGLLHAKPDDVAVTTSVSQGVSAFVSALDLTGERNRIVISEYEFPTVGQIAHAQALRGAEVVRVLAEPDGSIPPERFAQSVDERTALLEALTAFVLPSTGDEGYKKAEVTGGGIALDEVDSRTLESRRHQGLFLCGEMLDAFGPIGGYNFLWAWATGRAAGLGAGRMRN